MTYDYDIIIACEWSGTIRDAFISAGFSAISCDISPSQSPGPHIQSNILSIDLSRYKMLIANPPCTYLTKASAWRWRFTEKEQNKAIKFVRRLWEAPVNYICIENPPGILSSKFMPYSQLINPFQFGHSVKKQTCLWLKNLPPLIYTCITPNPDIWVEKLPETKNRSLIRGKTFPGIARAMAQQWGYYLKD